MQNEWVHWNVCSDFYIILNIKSVISLHVLVNIHSYQQSFVFHECFILVMYLKFRQTYLKRQIWNFILESNNNWLINAFLNPALMTFLKHQCTFFSYFNKNDNIYFQQRQNHIFNQTRIKTYISRTITQIYACKGMFISCFVPNYAFSTYKQQKVSITDTSTDDN